MPWLTIIMAVLAFFLSGGSKKENRGKAALAALAVGAGTYYVTHETEWGTENLGALDGVTVDVNENGTTTVGSGPTRPTTTVPNGSSAGSVGPGSSGSNGFWSSLGGWLTSPAGQVTTGTAAATALGAPRWLIWGGAALAVYLLLKD